MITAPSSDRPEVRHGWDAQHPSLPDDQPGSIGHALEILGIEFGHSAEDELPICCPLHNDRRPSASVNLRTGLWICHAGCGSGAFPRLVSMVTGAQLGHAVLWCSGIDFEAPVVRGGHLAYQGQQASDPDVKLWPASALDRFTDPPLAALKDRGISQEAAAQLSIRWDITQDAWVLPAWQPARARPHAPTEVEAALDAHFGRWDHIPYLLGWQYKSARKVWSEPRTRKSQTLFGISIFKADTTAILVESPLDVAVLLTADLDGGLATFGAKVSAAQLDLLAERASRLFVALDNDAAGRAAQERVINTLSRRMRVFSFSYAAAPDAKDIGEMNDEEIYEGIRNARREWR